MSLEKPHRPKNTRRDFITGAALSAGFAAAGAAGVEKGMEKINARILTPGAMARLQEATGATEGEILRLEDQLFQILKEKVEQSRSDRAR